MLFDAFRAHKFLFCQITEKIKVGFKIRYYFLLLNWDFKLVGVKYLDSIGLV